ncbi:hypothetical protein CVT26_005453 [Gymnopilus dilepis]|uniref:Amidohydrolase-related domain-containing protein n=1 Tax=Gymnopilus dilepis TaxID=231916 RepID=A0A409W8G3_9AGAR|nr:hypothetical protein CVT26_005453 [Gymnopilus dilepis]
MSLVSRFLPTRPAHLSFVSSQSLGRFGTAISSRAAKSNQLQIHRFYASSRKDILADLDQIIVSQRGGTPLNRNRDLGYTHSQQTSYQRPTATHQQYKHRPQNKMVKKKSTTPPESSLLLPTPPSSLPTVDTHTHVASTYEFYRGRYKEGKYTDVYEFVKEMYKGRNVEAVVDVWCEAPVRPLWKEFADAAMQKEKWGGMEYWFVLGVHPHDAKKYNDDVEKDILEAMTHPRCVGWGEMGLDYHYDNSPREIQQEVFTRQLKHAVRLNKPLTIHTREADDDTERILKEVVPKDHKIHIHCFTDSPDFAARLLAHFPNLYIGITGVITFATNDNTAAVIRNMLASPSAPTPTNPSSLRILLETDAPYMVPANIYDSLIARDSEMKGKKLPICHSAMVPWTAKFVADVANGVEKQKGGEEGWDADVVMKVARENARKVYGV